MSGLFSPRRSSTRRLSRLTSLILCLAMLLPLLPALPTSAQAADEPFYQAPIEKLSAWSVMSGYPDGDYRPNNPITRAEFVTMVNRAYGHTEVGPTPFQDVPASAWYADDIAIAYNAGYFSGSSATTASPNDKLTREQAMVLLAKNLRLDPIPGEVTQFTDGRDCASYSKGYINAAARYGLTSGYPDGTFRPQNNITRGEMATMLANAVGTLVKDTGSVSLGPVYGNLTINTSGVTLSDTTIAGDLYISGGLDLGSVVLDNVRVLGKIVVAGGGVSEAGQDSVVLRNVAANALLVDALDRQYLSLRAEGDTSIADSVLRTSAFVQDRTPSNYGLLNLSLDASDPGAQFTLSGNLENITNRSAASLLTVSKGSVASLTIDEAALGSTLTVDPNTVVQQLNLDTAATVGGQGDIDQLNVNAAGSTVSILPDEIEIRPGLTAGIAGENMDAKLGDEASEDPRLLAGYPAAKDVAPTSFKAVFSTNKSGTVYWGVSSITDGSVKEAELLSPSSYGSNALKSGNVKVTASNTEVTVPVTGLTTGGSYYLSAVLVDARGDRSPVKVVSFSTPDNTVPNFATGYPSITKRTSTDAQVAVMATKSCQLYWAVFPKGSSTPTAANFKSLSLSGNLGCGVMDIERNTPELFYVNNVPLTELASYDLYLWLTDADGAQSSAVKKLTFTTVDGTPPVFVTPLYLSAAAQEKSLTLSCALNEAGTVYWVIVEANSAYPKSLPGATLTDESVQLAIASGRDGIKSGKVTAKANTNATFTITGLTGETAYDIWYIGQDTAGNYSAYSETASKYTVSTKDVNPPKVTQEFTRYPSGNNTSPTASTSIRIIFSENVLQHSTGNVLLSLYNTATTATDADEVKNARKLLAQTLRETILLGNGPDSGYEIDKVAERTDENQATVGNDWVIDYRYATVAADGKKIVVTFPTNTENSAASALNLGSGSTYHFRIEDISDVTGNTLVTDVPGFTTASATVSLAPSGVTSVSYTKSGKTYDVTADAVFTMNPNSTKTMDPTLCWDMLFWADTTVEFDLYYTKLTSGGGSLVNADWKPLKSGVKLTKTTASSTYVGKSLFNDIITYASSSDIITGSTSNGGSSRPLIYTTLDDTATYAFAIHLTSYKGKSEGDDGSNRKAWGVNMNFRASVVSGDTYYLTNFTKGFTENSLEAELKATEQHIFDIGSPSPFTLPVTVPIQTYPKISTGYPRFTYVSDIQVKIDVQLDNPGNLYYVVASLDDYTPTMKSDGKTLTPSAYATQDDVEKIIPTSGSDTSPSPPVYVSNPTYLQVLDGKSWEALKPDVKTGYVQYTNGTAHITIGGVSDPLQSDTTYLIYFATEAAPYYSENAEVYTFTTDPLTRPQISLSPGTSDVGVTTDIASCVRYKLLQMPSGNSTLNTNLRAKFLSNLRELTAEEKTKYAATVGKNADTITTTDVITYYIDTAKIATNAINTSTYTVDGDTYRVDADITAETMTCLEAMIVNFNTGKGDRSLFDEFASSNIKNLVRDYIANQSLNDGTSRYVSPIVTQSANVQNPVDLSSYMNNSGRYIFLVSAYSYELRDQSTVPGESMAFRAYYYMQKVDTTPIQVSSVSADLTYDATTKTFKGDVILQFNKPLYYDPGKTTSGGYSVYYPVVHEGSSWLGQNPTAFSVFAAFTTTSASQVTGADTPAGDKTTPVQNVTFHMEGATSTTTITANSLLCDKEGNRPYNKSGAAVPLVIQFAISSSGAVTVKLPTEWDARTIK